MAVAIVDRLEAIDVDEADDELTARPTGAVDLAREHLVTHVAPVHAGEPVELGILELRLESNAIVPRREPKCRGAGAIGRRPISVGCGLASVGGGAGSIARRLLALDGRLGA
jgi:hypothetical protein